MNTRRTTTHSRITLFAATLLLLATHALAQSPGLTFAPETSVCLDNGRERTFSGLCVPKGGSADFTVQLASQPSADVTLTISKEDLRDSWAFTWSPANLTFTSANWNQAQTVTVSSSKHPTASWGQADLYLTPDSDDRNYDKLSRHLTRYRVYEYDTPALDFNPGAVTVNEGASGSYSVMLNTPPTANVTLTLSSEGDGDLTLDTDGSIDGNQNTITFTPEEWTWHRVHVFAAEDADDTHGSLTITHTAASDDADYNGMSRALTATENDNDATPPDPEPEPDPSPPTPAPQAGVVLSPTSSMCRDGGSLKPVQGLCVPMGGSADFTVRLATVPKANVTLDAITQNVRRGEHISVSPTSLDFTPDNWNETQTITATSSKQPPAAFGAITVYMRGTSDDPDYHERLALRAYTIQESDTAALVLGKSAVAVDEGLYTAYSIMLNTPPTANVTLTLSTSGSSDLSVDTDWNTPGNQNTVTFTPTDWEWHQIAVLSAEDVNLTDDSMTITHTSASSDAGYNGLTASVTVTETDNDTPSLVVSSTAVTVPEGGTASYTVKLSNQPNGGVAVAIEQGAGGDTDLSASTARLDFTTSTWNVAQTVTLSAAQDGDDLRGTRTFKHTASGANFGAAAAVTVTASEGDDDRRGFVVTPAPGSVTIREGGSHTYAIKLGTQPSANVTVGLAASGDPDVTVSPASLTFTAQNYASAQTVTIAAAEDNADYVDDLATVRHTVSTTDSIYSEFTIGDISVTAKDNDAALVLSATAVQILENGTATYTVGLTNQPSADVVVTIAEGTGSNDDTSITVSSPSNKRLTFTPADWSAQTVTLRASSDSDKINGTRAIAHTASGAAEFVGITASLTATARDAAARINVSKTTVDVPEEATATYDVSLNARPAANVTVTIAEADTGNDTDADITVTDPASKTLTFTPQNYATAQTVTLSAATDIDLADGRRTITHTASDAGNTKSGYAGVPATSITAREDDNDTGGLMFDKNTVSVAENGTGTYRVRLTHKPNGTVNVSVRAATGGSNDTDITVRDTNDGSSGNQTGSIRFTADNYDTYRTVTLAARDDADKTNGSRIINHTANGGGYSNVTGSVTANEADDDHEIVISKATLSVFEGSTSSYTVKLATAPSANVTITIAEATTGTYIDDDITVTSSKTLTFTSTTWNTAYTVTLSAAQNSDRFNGSRTINHSASGDSAYNGLTVSLLASEFDDDRVGDRDTSGEFDLNSANDNPYGIWSNGTTMWVLDSTDYKRYAYTLSTGTRDTTKEFGLDGSHFVPRGIWSDGTTMWVVEGNAKGRALYAYPLGSATRDTAKSFDLHPGNGDAGDIWSDGATIWVSDETNARVYAYDLAGGKRDKTREFNFHTDNGDPHGIWSDGTTMWVSDSGEDMLYAYTLASGARDSTKEFNLHSVNSDPRGIWSDGTTIWVADSSDGKLYAYHAPSPIKRLTATATATTMQLTIAWHTGDWYYKYTSPSGGQCSASAVSTASTRVTGLNRNQAYTFAAYSDSACSNLLATASSLKTKDSHLALSSFSKSGSTYDVDLTLVNWDITHDGNWSYKTNLSGLRGNCVQASTNPHEVTGFSFSANETHTFSAYGNSTCAGVAIDSAPPFTPGAGVPALTAGSITLSGATLTLSNFSGAWWHNSGYGAAGCTPVSSGTSTATLSNLTPDTPYTYHAFSASGCAQANTIDSASFTTVAVGVRDTTKEFDLHDDHYNPYGIWSDGTTMWTSDQYDLNVRAYTLGTDVNDNFGPRDSNKDFSRASTNDYAFGIWSDGTTMWVVEGDTNDQKLYAYTLTTGARDTGKEFDLYSQDEEPYGNGDATGIWSDGTIMWVADGQDQKVYAYTLATGARDATKEFDLHIEKESGVVVDSRSNNNPTGIWSDGTTMWVAERDPDNNDSKLYAYTLATGARDPDKEFDLHADNDRPYGIWSDGVTMWVADLDETYMYAYHAFPPTPRLTATGVTTTGATLNITLHNGAWWYKRTAPTGDNTCREVASGTTATLSNLTAGRSYTYKAYSQSGCASDNEMASVTFRTATLTAAGATATTMTLTIAGHTGNWYYKHTPGGLCSGNAVTTASTRAAGLTHNREYTFAAYSDSGCSNLLATASPLSTMTPALAAVAGSSTGEMDLTLSNWNITHDGYWRYKYTTPSDGDCSSAQTTLSATVTGLANSSHLFKAYSDNTCSDVIAAAASNTPKAPPGPVTVSNLGETTSTNVFNSIGWHRQFSFLPGKVWKRATAFTTGSAANGYTLNSVTAKFKAMTGDAGNITAAIYADSGGKPTGTALATLSGNNPINIGDYTYTCSGSGCSLSAGTKYHLVFSASVTSGATSQVFNWLTTASTDQTNTPSSAGWSIDDKSGHHDGNWKTPGSNPGMVSITATEKAGSSGLARVASVTANRQSGGASGDGATGNQESGDTSGDAANGLAGSHGQGAAALGSPGHVTNLASAQSGDSDVNAAQRQAVAFTTGPNPGGYVLKTITAALRKVSGDADLVLTLHETADDAPGPDSQPSATVLATLLGTAPASGAFADVTYTCSGLDSCRLEPDTTYFVVAASSGSGAYAWAYVASANLYTETTEPQDSGWDIGTGHASQDGDGWTSWGDWHHARLDFKGIPSPAVTVGNLDQAVHDDACFPSGDTKCAVAFTTGPSPDGYTLDAVTARFRDADDPDGKLGDIAVTLHADGGGVPGQRLATLIGANPDSAGDTTYICFGLEGCALKPNTTYFVQITASAGKYLNEAYEWASTLSDHETAVPKGNGWTLANGTDRYGSSWVKYRDVGLLKVRATTN